MLQTSWTTQVESQLINTFWNSIIPENVENVDAFKGFMIETLNYACRDLAEIGFTPPSFSKLYALLKRVYLEYGNKMQLIMHEKARAILMKQDTASVIVMEPRSSSNSMPNLFIFKKF